MLAITLLIGLLIVIPNGRWRDLVRPVAPGLAEMGMADPERVASGPNATDPAVKKRLSVPPLNLPLPKEEPTAEQIPLRIGF